MAKKKNNLYIIIVGCGRLGSKIAANLSNLGHSVVVVDKHETSFEHLTQEFTGFTIVGNATEIESLKKAKINILMKFMPNQCFMLLEL